VKKGLLHFYASRPGSFGLERHLVTIHDLTAAFNPKVVVIDPITNFESVGTHIEVKSMVTRLIDVFKSRHITALFTSLTNADSVAESSEVGISSQMDAWLLLRNLECNGERNRGLYVLKARGMAHSNQIREFLLTDHGVQLVDVYVGPSGMLTGSARIAQDRRERAEAADRQQQIERKKLQLTQKHLDMEAQIARMKAEFEAEQQSLLRELGRLEVTDKGFSEAREEMRVARQGDVVSAPRNGHAQERL